MTTEPTQNTQTTENVVQNCEGQSTLIYLDGKKTGWITLDYLPLELQDYATQHWEDLFKLRHSAKSKVINMRSLKGGLCTPREIDANRYYQSYGNTPSRPADNKKNYMFSDLCCENLDLEIPQVAMPLYDYMNSEQDKYNQVVMNWYEPQHFLSQHVDWGYGATLGSNIAMVTLNEKSDQKCRTLAIEIGDKHKNESDIVSKTSIELKHGLIIKLHGTAMTNWTHGIPPESEDCVSRIGMTFRQFDVKEQ